MSIAELPDELIQILASSWPCRTPQLQQMMILLSPHSPSPKTLIIQGPHASGKSAITQAYLESIELQHVVVRCRECVTERHLLEHTIGAVEDALSQQSDGYRSTRCESLSALASQLEKLLRGRPNKFVLVFDGIDEQQESGLTLGPAITRLSELIQNLVIILIVHDSLPGMWRKPGIPHIVFPAYTREQSIHIASREPLDIFTETTPAAANYSDQIHEEDKEWQWPRYCAAIWDSLGQSAARNLISYKDLCHKLWRPFIEPVVKGDFGTRDFSRLMVVQRKLFQDEDLLLDHIVPTSTPSISAASTRLQLPYHTKWLLLAAFLASTNPARLDALYFMKGHDKKRRRKGGVAAHTKTSQHKFPRHLMAPSPFPLDRLLAVLHAILPEDLRSSIDIQTQIATLTSLRLLARSSGIGLGAAVEAGSKWKIGPAVTWDLVSSLSGTLDFAVADFMTQ